ncbi:unnamed protein product [Linum tenue]|uniref:Expansin-like EG45 domain-containing protein n=1 Tax=Linum tenue TaxID=586396 RepID=A0AAV0I901_9ROSI|nr:unnamed protein product [Linum tenue]
MGVMIKSLALATVLLVVAFVPSPASAIAGTATFYTTYVPCYGLEDQGVMIAAVSDPLWNNGAACGRMYNVRCTDPRNCKAGSVTVRVVDRCPSPGCQVTLDLSQEAFTQIADPDVGRINIEYNQ